MTQNQTTLALRKLRPHPTLLTDSWKEMPDKYTTIVRRSPSIGQKVKDRCGATYLMRDDGSLYRLHTKSTKKSGLRAFRREVNRQRYLSTTRR